ncbi:hypothetical protein [Thiohalophilus sp.]|uniref:HvfA family oxazolone/thioamide-modified RiPP metallophore n=1 Tax=Thiohalophilus sp. TaxID=3028392 RepID=UPI002ACD2BCE|nr:hypothetical protein [Thiohalophilus sp.]MDZ7802924.1 hypothetical protein [Thiohalophilus sp.]
MSNRKSSKTLTLALGTAFAASMAASNVATAAEAGSNPFAMSELSSGYMQLADSHMEGKCGEGKCGGDKDKAKKEGKCGEGKCGGDKDKAKKEGKCGEGKCGGDKAKAKKEGKCGEGKCGGSK